MKTNYLDKNHPYLKDVESLMRETFCIGVLKTKNNTIAWAIFASIFMQILLIPLTVLMNFVKLFYLLLIVFALIIIDFNIEKIELFVFLIGFLIVYYKEIIDFLLYVSKAFLVLCSRGALLKWIAKGYLLNEPFRQSVIENEKNAELIAGISAVINISYRTKYDYILNLYLNSNTQDGEEKLVYYMKKLRSENAEIISALTT
jgi:hypothetical protein